MSAKYTNGPDSGVRHGLSVAEGSPPSGGRTDVVAALAAEVERLAPSAQPPPPPKTIRLLRTQVAGRPLTDGQADGRRVSVHVNITLPLSQVMRRFHIGITMVTKLPPRQIHTAGKTKRPTRPYRRPGRTASGAPSLYLGRPSSPPPRAPSPRREEP